MTVELGATPVRLRRKRPAVTLVTRGSAVPASLWDHLARDWPEVHVSERPAVGPDGGPAAGPEGAYVDADLWCAEDVDLLAFDRRVHAAEDEGRPGLVIAGAPAVLARAVPEVLTRYQRWFPRTNVHSDSAFFEGVLGIHGALHELGKPLVRADWEHALDTWQWTLRLEPEAELAVQLAALLHDVERLVSEPDRRIEHEAPSYQDFKDAHARGSAQLVRRILHVAEAWPGLAERVVRLVEAHEGRAAGASPDAALVAEADSLSFFSLNSAGFFAHFGAAHTELKVAYTLARMSERARARLGELRLVAPVARLVAAHRA